MVVTEFSNKGDCLNYCNASLRVGLQGEFKQVRDRQAVRGALPILKLTKTKSEFPHDNSLLNCYIWVPKCQQKIDDANPQFESDIISVGNLL